MVYTQIFQGCKGNVILDNTIHTQIQPKNTLKWIIILNKLIQTNIYNPKKWPNQYSVKILNLFKWNSITMVEKKLP